jgi:hypothetical protein
MNSEKRLELARAILRNVRHQANVMVDGPAVLQEYFDAGITFTDEELAAIGVSAATVVDCLTELENLKKFYEGGEPANAFYRVTVNKVRRVGV